jgi:predicted dehydrogenase
MKKYRTALVGLGDIAEHGHLPALLEHEQIELEGVCDVRPERRALFEKLSGGVPSFSCAGDLWEQDHLDAVVLALHPEHSVDIAPGFLARGIAVLDEKPLATSPAVAQKLGDVIRMSGTPYQVGFVFRYSGFAREIGDWIERLGPVRAFKINFNDEWLDRSVPEHFNSNQILSRSSVVNHEGSHFLDLVRFWTGSREDYTVLKAAASQSEPDFAGPNCWEVQLELNGGPALDLRLSWLLSQPKRNSMNIVGEGGELEVDPSSGVGWVKERGAFTRPLQISPMRQGWRGQLDAFVQALAGGGLTGPGFQDGLAVLKASHECEAMGLSLRPL